MRGPYPQTPSPLRDIDLGTLVGRPVDQARAEVESLGGELRAGLPGQALRANLRMNRITVVHEGDIITEVIGFG